MPAARNRHWIGGLSIAIAAAWAFLRAGSGVMPDLDVFTTWALDWPNMSGDALQQVYANSPLGHLTAQVFQVTSPRQFLFLHALCTLIAITGLAIWAFRSAPGSSQAQATRLFLLTPVVAILLAWLGYYDAFTALCWVVALFAWRSNWRTLMIAGGVLLGIQHFEQAAIGVVAWVLIWYALGDQPTFSKLRNPAWVLIGLPVGKVVLVVVLMLAGAPQEMGRVGWLTDLTMLRTTLSTAINNGPLLLWSMFAGFWAVVIYVFLKLHSTRQRVFMVSAIVLPLVMNVITFDRPRVFAMATIPVVLICAVSFAALMKDNPDKSTRVTLEAIVWLGTPLIFWGQVLFNFAALDRLIMLLSALAA